MRTSLKRVCSPQRLSKIGIFCLPAFPVPSKHQKAESQGGENWSGSKIQLRQF